jgi:hypothetical protein
MTKIVWILTSGTNLICKSTLAQFTISFLKIYSHHGKDKLQRHFDRFADVPEEITSLYSTLFHHVDNS